MKKVFDNYSRLSKLILINKKLILFFILLGFIIGIAYSYFSKDLFIAQYKFLIKDDRPKSLNGALASSFGFDINAIDDLNLYQSNNFPDLLKSRKVIENSLLKTVKKNNRVVTFADLYFNLFFSKSEINQKNYLFPAQLRRDLFSRNQDSVFNLIYRDIVDNRLTIVRDKKNQNVFIAEFNSESEFFSINFLNTIFDVVLEDYLALKSSNIKLLQDRILDLKKETNVMLNSTNSSTNFISRLNFDFFKSNEYNLELDLKIKILNNLTEQLEISKLNFLNNYQLIQTIDNPTIPLIRKKFNGLIVVFLSGFMFGLFSILYILLKKKYFQKY